MGYSFAPLDLATSQTCRGQSLCLGLTLSTTPRIPGRSPRRRLRPGRWCGPCVLHRTGVVNAAPGPDPGPVRRGQAVARPRGRHVPGRPPVLWLHALLLHRAPQVSTPRPAGWQAGLGACLRGDVPGCCHQGGLRAWTGRSGMCVDCASRVTVPVQPASIPVLDGAFVPFIIFTCVCAQSDP